MPFMLGEGLFAVLSVLVLLWVSVALSFFTLGSNYRRNRLSSLGRVFFSRCIWVFLPLAGMEAVGKGEEGGPMNFSLFE